MHSEIRILTESDSEMELVKDEIKPKSEYVIVNKVEPQDQYVIVDEDVVEQPKEEYMIVNEVEVETKPEFEITITMDSQVLETYVIGV